MKKYLLLLGLILVPAPLLAADDKPQLTPDNVGQYIDQTVGWYRSIPALDPLATTAASITIKDYVHQDGDKVVRLALDYAKAQAALFGTAGDAQAAQINNSDAPNIPKLQADNAAQIITLQGKLAGLSRAVKQESGGQRRLLVAQRDKTQSALDLAMAQRDLLATVSGFLTTTKLEDHADGLPGKIAELSKLVPDVEANQAPKTATKVILQASGSPTDSAAKDQDGPDNGIFSLTGHFFDLMRTHGRLLDVARQTNDLYSNNQAQVTALRAQLRAAIARGNAIGNAPATADPKQITGQQAELNQLVARFKLLSAAIAPLAEQTIWIEAAQRGLGNWSQQLNSETTTTLQGLLVRLALLALAILIPLFIARLAARATHKYVKDERRQRQLRVLRRIVLGIIIAIIISLNFFSEFGSLATYAGLITAGIAVALQNVILSMVAHFFFFGRFGVRVGDRVTVNSVTGDIIEIGILRFYLMELDDESSNPHPTGRVVAFPNSILFQQSAFFKQIPGTHYSWRAVTVSLPAGIDYAAAQGKLLAAVNSVYASYRADMETQQSILETSTRLKVRLPQPESNLKFAGSAISFEARYPVEMGRTSEIDDRVTQALLQVIHSGQEGLDGASQPEVKPATP